MGEPVIGKLATASAEGLRNEGPFSNAAEYFAAIGDAAISKLDLSNTDLKGSSMPFTRLGAIVFRDIVHNTALFEGSNIDGRFPLNHMYLGIQNIVVDKNFNSLAIIDWEFAQNARW